MKKFVLFGAAGYIAPRHLAAIKKTGNQLVAAYDPGKTADVVSSFFSNALFFDRFDSLEQYLTNFSSHIDFITICSPNYLHEKHVTLALKKGIEVICEKPLVLYPKNIERLKKLEKKAQKKVNVIMQMRYHPTIQAIKNKFDTENRDTKKNIELTYITARDKAYFNSWKGDEEKSGGITANIGIHFFDMLTWIYGNVQKNSVHTYSPKVVAGFLELEHARVKWFLSVDASHLPKAVKAINKNVYRSITIDGEELEFTHGFEDLHTISYKEILTGKGFGIDDCLASIQLVHNIRKVMPVGLKGEYHSLVKRAL